MKRIFNVDVANSTGQPIGTAAGCREAVGHRGKPDEICRASSELRRIIACNEDPDIMEKILDYSGEISA